MTDPTTSANSGWTSNNGAEITKKLFSPVHSEENINTKATSNSEQEAENKEDRLKKEDSLVEQAKVEIKPTVPKTEDLFVKTENAEEVQKINVIDTISQDVKSEPNPNVIEAPTANMNNEKPIIQSTTESNNPQQPEIVVNTKQETELQKDMQIIANIQKTEWSNTAPEKKNNTETTPTGNVFNLDNLNIEIPIPKPTTTETTKTTIAENPYDNLQKINPQMMPNINKTKESQTKNIGIGVFVVLLILGWFVMKTMYPIQYESIMGWSDEESISAEIEPATITGEMLWTGNELMAEIESGNVLLDSGNTLIDSWILESLTGNQESTEANHNAAGWENQEILEEKNTESVNDFKTKLETFANQGKISLEEGKKTNNKEVIKYGTALYKKSESYLQNLANGEEITTDEMTNILAELWSYLVKIWPTTDADVSNSGEISTQETEISHETTGNSISQTETTGTMTQQDTTTTSWWWEFNPDSFFGNQ